MFRPYVQLGLWHCKISLHVWEETSKHRGAEKQSMLLPSFLVFSFASYTLFFQRNLQAIKCIRAQAAFARS